MSSFTPFVDHISLLTAVPSEQRGSVTAAAVLLIKLSIIKRSNSSLRGHYSFVSYLFLCLHGVEGKQILFSVVHKGIIETQQMPVNIEFWLKKFHLMINPYSFPAESCLSFLKAKTEKDHSFICKNFFILVFFFTDNKKQKKTLVY